MLEIKNLSKSYGDFNALNNVSLNIKEGTIHGFLGKNGAGKTTTMEIICGIRKKDHGDVLIDGQSVRDVTNLIGYLPQSPVFYGYMTPIEYLNFLGKLCGLNKNEILQKSNGLLDLVGLMESKNRKIKKFSGGMIQRMGIATALFNNPKIIILDEPTSALDPEGTMEILELLKKLKEKGTTIFFSTHQLSQVEKICDDISIINNGKIILSSNLEALNSKYLLPIYDVELNNLTPQLIDDLKSIAGVKMVTNTDKSISIFTTKHFSSSNAIFNTLCTHSSDIISFNKRKTSIEDIFAQVTTEGGLYNE